MEDEASKCNECISWPVVGKEGKGGKGNKFKKFDFTSAIGEVKFIGAGEDERAGGAAMGLSFQVQTLGSHCWQYNELQKKVMSSSLAPRRVTIILKRNCQEI